MSHRLIRAAALAAGALLLPAAAQAATPQFYLSLGDSYAAGFQVVSGTSRATTHGFADQVPALAAERGYRLKLVNYGCGGATTSSLLTQKGCPARLRAKGGATYEGRTQATAAVDFLRRNRARTGLVTVSIGGNDVTACARESDPVPCVAGAVKRVDANVAALVKRLRAAAGPKVRIVGTTYPDVILGDYAKDANLAALSQVAFKSLLNPTLKKRYEGVGGRFVDVTSATGGYGPLDDGKPVPAPVERVCALTYYCSDGDIHARTAGYALIAGLVTATLPRR